MKKVERFLDLARSLAEHSDVYKYKHGACIVKKGKVLSHGFNQYKSHPLQRRYNLSEKTTITKEAPHYVHAEIKALSKLKGIDLSECEIYVYRLNYEGKNAISRPCAACMAAIINAGIKKIIYTTDTGYAQEVVNKEITHRLGKF